MAEHTTEQSTSVGDNGQQPADEKPWNIRDQIVNAMGQRELVTTVLQRLSLSPYNAHILYRPVFQHRFARIRRDDPPLYFGELLQGVSISLRERAGAWDREIATLAQAQDELDIVPLSLVEPEEIIWLWYPYIPLKKLTLVEGDPASGKTYLILAIAAGITQGYDLPDQDGNVGTPTEDRKGSVLYITAEDGMADTIRPRAEKCGADLTKLFVLREPQAISLHEPQALKKALERFRPKLMVLDPIQAFLGAVDMHRANEVRPLMTTLLGMAIHYECAIICVRHWTKATGAKAGHPGQGNVDFAAAPRSQIYVGESPHDAGMRVMAKPKSHSRAWGHPSSLVSVMTGSNGLGLRPSPQIIWPAQPNLQHHQRKDAMKWLKEFSHAYSATCRVHDS